MPLNPYLHGFLAIAAFMAVIWTAQLSGNWTTSGKISPTGQRIEVTGRSVEEIKGWMKAGDVAAAYGVPIEDLFQAFAVPAGTPADTPLKDFEKLVPGFEVTKLRDWLSKRG
jgi:hypothetical protein